MLRPTLALLGALLFQCSVFAQNDVHLYDFRADIQDLLDNATENYGIDGAEITIIYNDSFPAETFTSGLRTPTQAVDPARPWHFAGATALYTTYLILDLIEECAIGMYDSIGQHMNTTNLGLDGSITVHQLLTATSVLNEYWVTNPASDCFNEIWNDNPGVLGCPEDVLDCRPADKSAPGEYDYNNMNFLVMGFLIDSITGMSVEDLMAEKIFEPYDMKRTYLSACKVVTIDSINGSCETAGRTARGRSYG